jgi:hypothetical protein
MLEPYFNLIGVADIIWSRFIQYSDVLVGFSQNWIMQGSINGSSHPDQFTNYVFFDEASAAKFVKNNEEFIARYQGSRTSNVESIVRKPKIFVYNLEDFIESWEEKLHSEITLATKSILPTVFNAENILFSVFYYRL